jgi:hypothetical protein
MSEHIHLRRGLACGIDTLVEVDLWLCGVAISAPGDPHPISWSDGAYGVFSKDRL